MPRAPGLTALLAALFLAPLGGAGAAAQSIATLTARSEAERAAPADTTPPPAAAAAPMAAGVPVPVPAVTLYPGDSLASAAFGSRMVPQELVDRGGIIAREEALAGKVARRTLPAGQPVPTNAITDATVVTKGVATRVHLKAGGLAISGYALALESGPVGAFIRLKNMDSGQIIVGQVEADGSVRVPMP